MRRPTKPDSRPLALSAPRPPEDRVAIFHQRYNEAFFEVPMAAENFIDYYELLQIAPGVEAETIDRVYKSLSARYHPGNPRTGDASLFSKLTQAYRVLSDARARASYDSQYSLRANQPIAVFATRDFNAGIEREGNRRMGLLCLLYNRRRACPDSPGISILSFEKLMAYPREHLMFAIWYLKDATLIRQDQASDFIITALGVEHVERNLSAYPSLQAFLKSAESGEVERSEVD